MNSYEVQKLPTNPTREAAGKKTTNIKTSSIFSNIVSGEQQEIWEC